MRVRDYMTKQVFTLKPEQKLFAARRIMEWAHTRHVPVVNEQGQVEGMITHRDLLQASISTYATRISALERDQHLWGISVRDVMRSPVMAIEPDASLQEAAQLMRSGKFGALPVVEGGELVGIISEHDLLSVVEHLPREGGRPGAGPTAAGG